MVSSPDTQLSSNYGHREAMFCNSWVWVWKGVIRVSYHPGILLRELLSNPDPSWKAAWRRNVARVHRLSWKTLFLLS